MRLPVIIFWMMSLFQSLNIHNSNPVLNSIFSYLSSRFSSCQIQSIALPLSSFPDLCQLSSQQASSYQISDAEESDNKEISHIDYDQSAQSNNLRYLFYYSINSYLLFMSKPSKYTGTASKNSFQLSMKRQPKDVGVLTSVFLNEIVQNHNIEYLEKLCVVCDHISLCPMWYQKETKANKMKMLQIYQMAMMYVTHTKQIYAGKLGELSVKINEQSAKVKTLREDILSRKKKTDQDKEVIRKKILYIKVRQEQKMWEQRQERKRRMRSECNTKNGSNMPVPQQPQVIYIPMPSCPNCTSLGNQNYQYPGNQNYSDPVRLNYFDPNHQNYPYFESQETIPQTPIYSKQQQQQFSEGGDEIKVLENAEDIRNRKQEFKKKLPPIKFNNIFNICDSMALRKDNQDKQSLKRDNANGFQVTENEGSPDIFSRLPASSTNQKADDVLQDFDKFEHEQEELQKERNNKSNIMKLKRAFSITDSVTKTELYRNHDESPLRDSVMGVRQFRQQSIYSSNMGSALHFNLALQSGRMNNSLNKEQPNPNNASQWTPKAQAREKFRKSSIKIESDILRSSDIADIDSPNKHQTLKKQTKVEEAETVTKYAQLYSETFALISASAMQSSCSSMRQSAFFGSLMQMTVQIDRQKLHFSQQNQQLHPQLHHQKELIVNDFDDIEIPMNSTIARPSRAKDSVIKRSRIISQDSSLPKQGTQDKRFKKNSQYMSEIDAGLVESRLHNIPKETSDHQQNPQSVKPSQQEIRQEKLKAKILDQINSHEPSKKNKSKFSSSVITDSIKDKIGRESQQLQPEKIISKYSQSIKKLRSSMKHAQKRRKKDSTIFLKVPLLESKIVSGFD